MAGCLAMIPSLPASALVAAICVTLPQEPPAPQALEEAATTDELQALHRELEQVEALLASGEVEGARARLLTLARGRPAPDLARAPHATLARLDEAARTIDDLEILVWVRSEGVRRLESSRPADDPILISAKEDLGAKHFRIGEFELALVQYRDVLALRERLLPADAPERVRAQVNVGLSLNRLGRIREANEILEEALAIWEPLLPPTDRRLLDVKQIVAVTRRGIGDFLGALALEEALHATKSEFLSAEHPQVLYLEENLAMTHRLLGNLEEARSLLEHVHQARERALPPGHPDLMAAKGNLALMRKTQGDLEGALALEELVHSTLARELPGDHPSLLRSKGNLASTRLALGDLEGALALDEYVHAAWSKLLPPGHPDLLSSKTNLARSLMAIGAHGELERVLALESAVLEVYDQRLEPDHHDMLSLQESLATTYKRLGRHEQARALEEHVLRRRAESLPADHPSVLIAKGNLAGTKAAMGELQDALELEEFVHGAWSRLLPPDHPNRLIAMSNLAETRALMGDHAGALALALEIVRGTPERASFLATRSPRFARTAASNELSRLAEERRMVRSLGEHLHSEALFEGVEAIRLAATEGYDVARAKERFPGIQRRLDELSRVRRDLGNLSGLSQSDGVARLLELTETRDRLERELRTALRENGVSLPKQTLQGIRAGLAEARALVSYIAFPTGELVAFVVSKESFAMVELGPLTRVVEAVSQWRSSIASTPKGAGILGDDPRLEAPAERGVGIAPRASTEDEVLLGTAVREMLIDPCLEPLDAQVTSLSLVLDDVVHLVPLDALPFGEGGRLGDAYATRFLPSTRSLLVEETQEPPRGTLVAFGGVAFGEAKGTTVEASYATPPVAIEQVRSGAAKTYPPLPETTTEVQRLTELYEGEFEGARAIRASGGSATKTRLVELAPQARFLHVATHGYFASEAFSSERDVLEQGPSIPSFDHPEARIKGFAPWLLCGLALAGANRGALPDGQVPGIMTAEELAALDLTGCELAVLSACETNVGERRAGAGIQSLQTALLAAGARATITSLWKVDDAATRRFFELFYAKLWSEGLPKGEALWQTKLEMRRAGHPIRHWGAWMLTGDAD